MYGDAREEVDYELLVFAKAAAICQTAPKKERSPTAKFRARASKERMLAFGPATRV